MKTNIILQFKTALIGILLIGAFSSEAFAQKKQVETVKTKVKSSPTSTSVDINSNSNEANSEEPKTQNSSSGNQGILDMGAPHIHGLGLGIGQTFPFGKFADYGDSRVHFPDLFYTYSASYSFDFLFNIHYTVHETTNKKLKLFGIAPAVKAKLFQYDAFSPFIVGGLGFYVPRWEDQGNESKNKMVFGTNIGFGGDLKLNQHFIVGILFMHHNPFDVKQESAPKVEGYYAKMLLTGTYTF